MPAHANYGQSFWLFAFGSTAVPVAMAWLFVHTRGSLALAMLMHSAVAASAAYFLWRLGSRLDALALSHTLSDARLQPAASGAIASRRV